MSGYLEALRDRADSGHDKCSLGRVLVEKGQEEYEAVIGAIFGKDEHGHLYPPQKVADVLRAEGGYRWSESLIRRHREGKCQSCLNR